ncbi:hypothetical protein ABZ070_15265 [Streptomyces sp. NPDC006283]|uniref:hypothetical protein n=1 Tax=Streptomyces sp. NPDC006283 TaxID=3156741 RepID=UPI0033AD7A5D
MTAKRKSLARVVACASVIVVLTGCTRGGDSDIKAKGVSGEQQGQVTATSGSLAGLDAGQIADKAVAATKDAKSLKMAGRIEKEGEPVSIDLALDAENCTGLLGAKGGRAELRKVAKAMYLKGDEQFWNATLQERSPDSPGGSGGGALVEMMKGRWITLPAGTIEAMDRVCDLRAVFSEMDMDEADRKQMTNGPDAQVDGVPTATLVKKAEGRTTTVHVAKEGKPHILKIVKTGGTETGTILLSDYGKPVEVKAPPAGEVVDLENLTGGAGLGTGFEAGESQTGEAPQADESDTGESGTGESGTGESGESAAGDENGQDTGSERGTGSDTGASTGSEADSGTGTRTESGARAESGSASGGHADADTDADTGSGAGTAADGPSDS